MSPVPGLRSQSNLEVPYLEMLSSVWNTASPSRDHKISFDPPATSKGCFLSSLLQLGYYYGLRQLRFPSCMHCSEIDVSLQDDV